MIRRSLTPPVGIPVPGLPPTRRAGGARRNVSDRVAFYRGAAALAGWTLNVSRGGLRAVLEEHVELGEELELQLGEEPARRRGRVVWTQEEPDGTIVGVLFLERMTEAPPGIELDASVEIGPGELAKKLGLTEVELAGVLAPPDEKGPAGSPA